MDEAKVPMRVHLKVLKVLSDRINAHEKSNKEHEDVLEGHKKYTEKVGDNMQRHEGHMEAHERQIQEWDTKVENFMAQDWTGEQGEMGLPGLGGKDGETPDLDALVEAVLERMPVPENGKDGKDAEVQEDRIITLIIKKIQKEKSLDLTHIKGAQTFLKDGVKYKFEELMHGGGSKGGSFAVQVPIGTVDGVNRTFVFTTAPSIIALDNGNFMNQISSDGTVNWTIVGTTVTLKQAPLFNIYGF